MALLADSLERIAIGWAFPGRMALLADSLERIAIECAPVIVTIGFFPGGACVKDGLVLFPLKTFGGPYPIICFAMADCCLEANHKLEKGMLRQATLDEIHAQRA